MLAAALAGAPALAKKGSDDGAKSRSSLAATGAVPEAEGECRVNFGSGKSRFEVRVENLAENAEHVLSVNDSALGDLHDRQEGPREAALLVAAEGLARSCRCRATRAAGRWR